MNRLTTQMRTVPALIAALLLAVPVAEANVGGVTLTFLPGRGLKPVIQTEQGVPQSGQQITTGASEIREVLFPDGTSLTLSPNSDVTVNAISDGEGGPSRLALSVNEGLVRIAGGTLNGSTLITVKTASGEVRLDAASAVIEVDSSGRTRASMLAGREVQMKSGGQTQSLERPGFELVSRASQRPPDSPSREPEGAAATDAFGLGTAQLAGLTQRAEEDLGRVGLAELAATGASTLAIATEDRPAGTLVASTGAVGPAGQPAESPVPTTPVLPTTPVPVSPPASFGSGGFSEIGSVKGSTGSAGFGPGQLASAVSLDGNQPNAVTSLSRSVMQSRDSNVRVSRSNPSVNASDATRSPGLTTNRLFQSAFTQVIGPDYAPLAAEADSSGLNKHVTLTQTGSSRLQYVFLETYAFAKGTDLETTNSGFALELPSNTASQVGSYQTWVGDTPGSGNVSDPPFILPRILGPNGKVATAVVVPNPPISGVVQGSIFGVTTAYSVLQAGFSVVLTGDLPNATADQRTTQAYVNGAEVSRASPSFPYSGIVVRNADNFILMQAEPADGSGQAQYIFATGNVDAGRINTDLSKPTTYGTVNNSFQNTFSVDKFFISAGLTNFDQKDQGATVGSDIRAFMRKNTSLGLPLADSGLLVVNTAGVGSTAQNGFIHADFGMQGAGAAQQSTISLTIGNGTYSSITAPCPTCTPYEVATIGVNETGLTIGSSHGLINGTHGTVAINSPLISTSAGGGNPQLPLPGYAGYFVFENYTPSTDVNFTAALDGGTEHALGSATTTDVNYAALRLATATGEVATGSRGTNVLTGWTGGLAETENGAGMPLTITPVGTGTDPGNFVIQTNAATNRVLATVLLSGHAPITLGAGSDPSVMIDDNRFGAANASVAMLNANLLRDANGNLPAALNLPNGQPIANYQYLQWGFLFGDTAGTAGTNLEHLNLGTWIAGRPADPSQLPTTGSASYTGHTIGNVASGNALYTAVGSYDNTWNFAQRAGTVNINFDGARYSGTTQLGSGVAFNGGISATGASRTGGVVGGFVQAPGGSPAATPPPALAGRFVIQETAGSPYRASGTFGAERNK